MLRITPLKKNDSLTFLFHKASFRSASVKCDLEVLRCRDASLFIGTSGPPWPVPSTPVLPDWSSPAGCSPGSRATGSVCPRWAAALELTGEKSQRSVTPEASEILRLEKIRLTLKVDDAVYLIDEAIHTTLCDHLGGDLLCLSTYAMSLINRVYFPLHC